MIPSLKRISFKNRNFGGFFPGKEVPKPIFWLQWLRLPHNLGLYADPEICYFTRVSLLAKPSSFLRHNYFNFLIKLNS